MPYELLEVKRDVCLIFSHTYMHRTMHETDNTVGATNKRTIHNKHRDYKTNKITKNNRIVFM